MAFDLVLSGPARGEDFCFRAAFLPELWAGLKDNNTLLVAPRRMGKTSVMYHLLDHPCDNFLVVYLNAENLSTPANFIIHLIQALKGAQPDYFAERLEGKLWSTEFFELEGTETPRLDWNEHWEAQATQLFGWIRKAKQPVLFVLDELPDMFLKIQNKIPEQFEPFLRWFRSAREISNSPVRWVVGGSTSLVGSLGTVEQAQWINDFYQLVLPSISNEEMKSFAGKMFKKHAVEYDGKVIPRIQELLGKGIPFYLQSMVKELVGRWNLKKEPLTESVVDEVFEKEFLGIRMLGHLQHFHSRIGHRYPEIERAGIYDLLSHLAVAKGVDLNDLFARYVKIESKRDNPRKEKQLMQAFGRLLLLLQIDFYIEDIGERKYDFSCNLLKLWWKKYYGPA